jgi:hypothetical protein
MARIGRLEAGRKGTEAVHRFRVISTGARGASADGGRGPSIGDHSAVKRRPLVAWP